MHSQLCPQHVDEDVVGVLLSDPEGAYSFTCTRQGHVHPGPFSWLVVPPAPGSPGLSELAQELNLDIELPTALQKHAGQWVEYGVLEQAYAENCPSDFALLVDRYGHTARQVEGASSYTVSAFLAGTLGHLSKKGLVVYHDGPATGRWSYNSSVSWWALPPAPEWGSGVSWEQVGSARTYVPGCREG